MMQAGIFTGYFPYALKETAERIRKLNFNTVQLDLTFKDMDLSTEGITREKCHTIRDTFRDHYLPICCISGYTNIVHPDKGERKKRVDHLKKIIRHARDLGAPYVISETGTFATDSDWVHHPKNKTEEGFADCVAVVRELVQVAYDHGAVFLLETYVNNVVGSVNETLRMFSAINHSSLGLLMDPTNYFEAHNIGDMDGELNRVFNALSDKIRIGHAKDVKLAGTDK
jgi:sugar phosphate isomerase/epimerase